MSSWDGKAYNENGEPLMTGTQYRDECAADAQSQIDAMEYDNEYRDYPEPTRMTLTCEPCVEGDILFQSCLDDLIKTWGNIGYHISEGEIHCPQCAKLLTEMVA